MVSIPDEVPSQAPGASRSLPPHRPQPITPTLHLYPLNDTFAAKQISITKEGVVIGRQCIDKIPKEDNGYFDNKTLSRRHALVWVENGKILVKDTKSSNGTYLNSQRLSPLGVESVPIELRSGCILEFGVDIKSDDGTRLVHRKVAARVYCVMREEDLGGLPSEVGVDIARI